MTGLISIIMTIALVGLVVWLICHFIPMPGQFRTAIYIMAGVFLLLFLLDALGLYSIPVKLR